MANQFSINPLGGYNPGAGLNQALAGRDAKRAAQEEKMRVTAQRNKMQEAMAGAAKGDPDAIDNLFAINPDLASKYEGRLFERQKKEGVAANEAKVQAELGWAQKYKRAIDSGDEIGASDLVVEAESNPLIDFDSTMMGKDLRQDQLVVNTMLYKGLGKDAYKQLIGGNESGVSGQPSAVQETEWFNKQTKEVQDTHLLIKRGEKPTLDQKLGYEKAKSKIKEDAAISTARQKTQNQKIQGYIDSGVSSADNLIAVNRSLELLKEIETGGIDNAIIRAKQMFGIESGDEAELSYELGKSVLKQLKPTFGAAFTVNEMLELKRMEAGLGKSVAGNIRILNNLSKVIKRSANRGMRAAENLGNDFAANEIRLALEGNAKKGQPEQLQQTTTSVNWADL